MQQKPNDRPPWLSSRSLYPLCSVKANSASARDAGEKLSRLPSDFQPARREKCTPLYSGHVVVWPAKIFQQPGGSSSVQVAPPIYPSLPYQFNVDYTGSYHTSADGASCPNNVSIDITNPGVYAVKVNFASQSPAITLLYANAYDHGLVGRGRPVYLSPPTPYPRQPPYSALVILQGWDTDGLVFANAGTTVHWNATEISQAISELQKTYNNNPMDVVLDGHGDTGLFTFGDPNNVDQTMQGNNQSVQNFIAAFKGEIRSIYFLSCLTGAGTIDQNHLMKVLANGLGNPIVSVQGWNDCLVTVGGNLFRNPWFGHANGAQLIAVQPG